MIVLVYIPGKTNFVAKILGMERGNDAMFFLAIAGLFYASYRLYVKTNTQEKEITKLVRALALKNVARGKILAKKRQPVIMAKSIAKRITIRRGKRKPRIK